MSLSVLLLFLVMLPVVGRNYVPKIVNGKGLTKDRVDAIISVEQGYYNSNLPLFATQIEFIENAEGYLLYRVYYFPITNIQSGTLP